MIYLIIFNAIVLWALYCWFDYKIAKIVSSLNLLDERLSKRIENLNGDQSLRWELKKAFNDHKRWSENYIRNIKKWL